MTLKEEHVEELDVIKGLQTQQIADNARIQY